LTNGKFADGHLVEKSTDFDLAKKTGTVTLHGRIVEDEKELMDLRATPAKKPAEITVAAADIKKMENYGPKHNTFTAIYFTLTGLHALHILGGTLVIFYFWAFGGAMWKTDPERFTNRIEVSGLFWHFVDLVWIFLFPVLYLT
jgi:cytochrome c oxidase subunit 3